MSWSGLLIFLIVEGALIYPLYLIIKRSEVADKKDCEGCAKDKK